MASFGQLKLTNLGIQAQLNAQNGSPLKFTKIGMGSGEFSGDVSTLTNLVKEEVLVGITKAYIEDGVYVVTGSFSNETLETTFVWREIGLYFEDENGNNVLYCYSNAGNKYDDIPASTDERFTKTIRIATAISNAENVSIVESAGATYVEAEFFDAFKLTVDKHMANKENPHGVTAAQVGAIAWLNTLIDNGSIKTWIETLSNPTSAGVSPNVSDMPFEGQYWIVSVDISNYGNWKIAKAVEIRSDGSFGRIYWIANINGSWSEWTTHFLPLTGGTLKGQINILDSVTNLLISLVNAEGAVNLKANGASNSDYRILALFNPDKRSDVTDSLKWYNVVSGVNTGYKIFGEHNKPSGTYTGNGNAASRAINTGGIGNALLLTGYGYAFFVTPRGALGVYYNNGTVTSLTYDKIRYENGVLTLATDDVAVNANGSLYEYECL